MSKKFLTALGVSALAWLASHTLAQQRSVYVVQAEKPMPEAISAPGDPALTSCEANCCSHSGGGWRPTFEAGVYILKPHWQSNPAFYVQTSDPQGAVITNFNYDYDWAPQIAIGAENCNGCGFRVSWWQLDASDRVEAAPFTTAQFPAPLGLGTSSLSETEQLIADSNLRMVVWDFEATQRIQRGRWNLLATGGVRYAHMSQDFSGISGSGGAIVTGESVRQVTSGHNFNGAGPTVSLDAACRLGSSNVFLYAMGRGSVLFGEGKQFATYTSFDSFPSIDTIHEARDEYDTIIPVGEVEVGGRWEGNWGSSRVFMQVGLIGQAWVGAGNSTRATVMMSNSGSPSGQGVGPQIHDLGLIGVNLKGGLKF